MLPVRSRYPHFPESFTAVRPSENLFTFSYRKGITRFPFASMNPQRPPFMAPASPSEKRVTFSYCAGIAIFPEASRNPHMQFCAKKYRPEESGCFTGAAPKTRKEQRKRIKRKESFLVMDQVLATSFWSSRLEVGSRLDNMNRPVNFFSNLTDPREAEGGQEAKSGIRSRGNYSVLPGLWAAPSLIHTVLMLVNSRIP